MSRKDFELIANVLKTEAEGWSMDHPIQSHYAGLRLAFHEALKTSNPRFDGNRFLLAAKPDPEAFNARIEALRAL
jgi:hypothetical protein